MLEVCVSLLLTSFQYSPVCGSVYNILFQLKQESADKKFGNVGGYRLYKRTTRLCSFLILLLVV